jgi:hypothetical protein
MSYAPSRCCICRGYRQVGELKDMIYVEPIGDGPDPDAPAYVRGRMCEECAVVHWAWEEESAT